jgi:hypothetical protein
MTKFGECLADEALARTDVRQLKAQLERLEKTQRERQVNALADEIADGLRAKIRQLGETPCVPSEYDLAPQPKIPTPDGEG